MPEKYLKYVQGEKISNNMLNQNWTGKKQRTSNLWRHILTW